MFDFSLFHSQHFQSSVFDILFWSYFLSLLFPSPFPPCLCLVCSFFMFLPLFFWMQAEQFSFSVLSVRFTATFVFCVCADRKYHSWWPWWMFYQFCISMHKIKSKSDLCKCRSLLCTIEFQLIKCQSDHSHRLLFTECLILNKLGMCKQLFVQFSHTLALWQCVRNHLSISHILSLHPCHGRKLTRFDTTVFPDWSVIGALHLSVAAPNALWVFSRHDPIFSYFNPVRGKLTNNTRISHCFYRYSSTFIA